MMRPAAAALRRTASCLFTGVLTCIVVAGAAAASSQSPADWPQLFGASRNAISTTPIRAGASLSVAWTKPMPSGGGGVVVSGDRLYTIGTDGEQDVLFALDAATGNEAWRLALGNTHADALSNGPNSTPVIAGELVLTVSSLCRLQAVNATTHQVVWTQDIGATYSSRFVTRGGCGMAPLVAGSRVVLVTGAPAGPRLAAFDVGSGTLAWTTADLPNGYNVAPGWMPQGGGPASRGGLVLYHHSKPPGVSGVTAVRAETGAVVWQIDGQQGESEATPVAVSDGRILIETWPQVSLFDIETRTSIWTSREIAAQRSPAIAYKGHLYTYGGQSSEFLTCMDLADGKVKWTSRIYRGHLALAGDTLVVLSESAGLLRLVAADPSGYRELANVQVLRPGARTGTPPSLAGGRIFVRNLDELVAVEVR